MLELRVGNWECIEYSVLVWLAAVFAFTSVPCARLCVPVFFKCSAVNATCSSRLTCCGFRPPPLVAGVVLCSACVAVWGPSRSVASDPCWLTLGALESYKIS